MRYQVTPARLKAWQHPVVQVVAKAAATASDAEIKKVLKLAVFGEVEGRDDAFFGVAWNGFMPLPFTEDSVAGKRLTALWAEVKREQSNSAQVQEFKWLFWRPERDAEDAAFVGGVLGQEPVYHELAA